MALAGAVGLVAAEGAAAVAAVLVVVAVVLAAAALPAAGNASRLLSARLQTLHCGAPL